MNEKSVKIGIITFHRAFNYGAMLQAFALMHFLRKQNYKAEIIDFWPPEMQEEYLWIPNFHHRNWVSKVKGFITLLFSLPITIARRKGYISFVQKHLLLDKNPQFSSAEQLKRLNYDIVIYGSDQIWRKHPFTHQFNPVYWGDGIDHAKRIAYGVSSNLVSFEAEEASFVREKLSRFSAISVREKVFANLIQPYSPMPVELVCDPVFLLDKDDWIKLAQYSKIRIPQKPYVLFYHLNYSPEVIPQVNEIARLKNLSIVEIRGRVFPFKFGSRYNQKASPVDFIKLIQHADLVITNSFHGTAFAILFEKEFFVVGANKAPHRIKNLLELFELENRFIAQDSTGFCTERIDYEKIKSKMEEWRKNSSIFLQKTIASNGN